MPNYNESPQRGKQPKKTQKCKGKKKPDTKRKQLASPLTQPNKLNVGKVVHHCLVHEQVKIGVVRPN